MTQRYLVVNADDFGLSSGVNAGIIRAHEYGIVTSASLMVRQETAAQAAGYAEAYPALAIGLHIDLGEWIFQDGRWRRAHDVVDLQSAAAVELEIARQLDTFRSLTGQDPTHVDSHQHVHRGDPARGCIRELARDLDVPLRSVTPGVHYCGSFYGQDDRGARYPESVSVDALLSIVGALPAGITELGCHPGLDTHLDSVYREERLKEAETLCDPRVKRAIAEHGIELLSFASVPRMLCAAIESEEG